jgi:IS30 family transposase
MIAAAPFARIRRMFFAEHWKVGTIASALGVHHDTVERVIESDRFVRTQGQLRRSLLDRSSRSSVNVRYLPEALAEYEAAASWYEILVAVPVPSL